MKQFIYLLLFAIIHVPVKSQNLVQIPVVNLQAKVEGKQVILVWHSDEAVSYTHLDVYKRQLLGLK